MAYGLKHSSHGYSPQKHRNATFINNESHGITRIPWLVLYARLREINHRAVKSLDLVDISLRLAAEISDAVGNLPVMCGTSCANQGSTHLIEFYPVANTISSVVIPGAPAHFVFSYVAHI